MIKNISVVVAIGGVGSRLKKVTGNIPKPLFPVKGVPTLTRTLIELKSYGFKKIIVTTCFKKEIFKEFLKQHTLDFDELFIYEEHEPLGECGALWKILPKLESQTLFINGDLIFSINFEKLVNFHKRINSDITLVTHPSSHPEDSDMVSCPNGSYIEHLFHKSRNNKDDKIQPLLGNSGISIFETSILNELQPNKNTYKPSLFGFLVDKAFKNKKRIFSYNTSEYIKDMGTPNRLKQVEKDISNNILRKKNYSSFQKALFLDRDNTLIKCDPKSYILSGRNIKFLDENIYKLAKISNSFSIIAIVTNQPQISMNKLSLEELEDINNKVILYCRSKSLLIDTVIWCPHHPHKGFESENKLLKKDCFCRKPNPGMLLELSYQRNIDLNSSLFVGDSLADSQAANSAGCEFKNIITL